MTTDLKKTPLYQNYVDSGAKIVEFGGWAMPVQFSSIKEEHNAVRYNVGLFDVSHMGEIEISGKDAEQFIQYILSNDTNLLTNDKAMYSALCNDEGGIIDDLVTYKLNENHYLLIVNFKAIFSSITRLRKNNRFTKDLYVLFEFKHCHMAYIYIH